MKELTVSQQEAIDGGWSWYGLGNAFAQAGSACDAIGYYCPDLAPLTNSVDAACDVASLGRDAIGWISSHFQKLT